MPNSPEVVLGWGWVWDGGTEGRRVVLFAVVVGREREVLGWEGRGDLKCGGG